MSNKIQWDLPKQVSRPGWGSALGRSRKYWHGPWTGGEPPIVRWEPSSISVLCPLSPWWETSVPQAMSDSHSDVVFKICKFLHLSEWESNLSFSDPNLFGFRVYVFLIVWFVLNLLVWSSISNNHHHSSKIIHVMPLPCISIFILITSGAFFFLRKDYIWGCVTYYARHYESKYAFWLLALFPWCRRLTYVGVPCHK